MSLVPIGFALLFGACATTQTSKPAPTPSQPQTFNAEYCRKLVADEMALSARSAEVNGAAPSDPAVDASWRRSQKMCADLVKGSPSN